MSREKTTSKPAPTEWKISKGKLVSGEQLEDFGPVIANALDVAHSAGIVHRALKPANLPKQLPRCAKTPG